MKRIHQLTMVTSNGGASGDKPLATKRDLPRKLIMMSKHNNKQNGNDGRGLERSLVNALNSGNPVVVVGAIAIVAILVIGRLA